MTTARGVPLAGAAIAALVALATGLAWLPGSPVSPDDGAHEVNGSAWAFLAALAGAFAAYVAGLALLRRGARIALVAAVGATIQLAPLAAPLLLSTDAWTYWGYGWIAAEGNENPYVVPPAGVPASPASRYVGADWRDTTSVYGPAFTLASEPVALLAGDSPDRAAWTFKALAAVAILVAAGLAARVSRRPALAFALVAWNPVLAVHLAGGGHNDGWVGALLAASLALAAAGRKGLAGATWAVAILVKWVPVLFLVLQLLTPRGSARRPHAGAVGLALGAGAALATWRYGVEWARAVVPLAGNAARETSFALPARLEQLGLPDHVARGLALAGLAAGLALLVRSARAGRPRLGASGCLVLATSPYLAPWYLAWLMPLTAADDGDRLAVGGSLVLTAYLLPQTIPV